METTALDQLMRAGVAVLMAAAPLALYLFCVRPALWWLRAQWTAHAAIAVISLIPAAITIMGWDDVPALLVGWLATMAVIAAWLAPVWLRRITGGPGEARNELDIVSGYLSPAGRFLDVGDLASAATQVEEARRHSTPATRNYVDLWDKLVQEEHLRRGGQLVSRVQRLEAISAEYARLTHGSDPLRTWFALILVAVIGAIAAAVSVIR